MDPSYGMFIQSSESGMLWFNPASLEAKDKYFLIGMLSGLALYNSIIVRLNFPLVLFRQLLEPDCKLSVYDLFELEPTVAASLKQLADFESNNGETIEDVFSLNFECVEEF